MSVYMTEAEQIEWLKKGWLRYQTWIVSGLCLILLLMSAVRYWNFTYDKQVQQASSVYQRMMLAESHHDTQKTQVYAEQLIKDDTGLVYADAARLMLAAIFARDHKYDQAIRTLEFLIKHSSKKSMVDLAKLRLARLWLVDHNHKKALDTLHGMKDSPYYGLVNVIKGDIYVAQGNKTKAMNCYQLAHTYLEKAGVTHVFLDMKLEQLKEEG